MTRKELIDYFEKEPSVLIFVLAGMCYVLGDFDVITKVLMDNCVDYKKSEKYIVF